MRGNTITGVKTLLGFGPKISSAVAAKPDGLLAILARLRVAGGVVPFEPAPPMVAVLPAVQRRHGFLDEAYMRRGRMEAVYVDKKERIGLAKFAPVVLARGLMFLARKRVGLAGEAAGQGAGERNKGEPTTNAHKPIFMLPTNLQVHT